MQKTRKTTETMAKGYSSESTQQELSNEYQDDRVSMFFKNLPFLCFGNTDFPGHSNDGPTARGAL